MSADSSTPTTSRHAGKSPPPPASKKNPTPLHHERTPPPMSTPWFLFTPLIDIAALALWWGLLKL